MDTKEEINRTISIRLAALCGSKSINPGDLAEAVGLSRSQINRILAAKAAMSAAHLVLAAKRIGVTTSVITNEEKFGERSR
ncbi:MAG: hypothetical protein BGO05_05235 [Rhizobiales bacterium 63-7]|nr:helix-turn-helix transcriptional regulator [Hyphomicrobiales bacterium]OJU66608.1 MAG: hypothetical protein BGO05_05235 [Rhizobiales bacterium 63-7]